VQPTKIDHHYESDKTYDLGVSFVVEGVISIDGNEWSGQYEVAAYSSRSIEVWNLDGHATTLHTRNTLTANCRIDESSDANTR
jgi:hypothetical protein